MRLIDRILAANLEDVLAHSSCPDLLLGEILQELGRENERQRLDLIRLRDRRSQREEEYWQTQRTAARLHRLAEVLLRQGKPEDAAGTSAQAEAAVQRSRHLAEDLAASKEHMGRLKTAMNRLQGCWMAANLLRGRFPPAGAADVMEARLEMERLLPLDG